MFASHCLLNENVRYLGGACTAGPVTQFLEKWQADGVGICQMACPEQLAWGGVLKRWIAPAYGSSRSIWWPLRSVLLPVFMAYTKIRYGLLARQVAAQIRDYRRSGFDVVGVVGVGGSPSCGVHTTLNVRSWLNRIGQYPLAELDRGLVNASVIASAEPGAGLFTSALIHRLTRARISVPLAEHDLLDELARSARLGKAQ